MLLTLYAKSKQKGERAKQNALYEDQRQQLAGCSGLNFVFNKMVNSVVNGLEKVKNTTSDLFLNAANIVFNQLIFAVSSCISKLPMVELS